jgi:hypothetical protein
MRRQGAITSLDFPTDSGFSDHLRRDAGFEGSCDFGINSGKRWCPNLSPEVYFSFPKKCGSQFFRNICSYTITDTPSHPTRLSLHKHCSQSFKNGKGKNCVKAICLCYFRSHTRLIKLDATNKTT